MSLSFHDVKLPAKILPPTLFERLQEYERAQNEIKVLRPSGYAFRSVQEYGSATCYMCGKTLTSVQGFANHVDKCEPEDDRYTIVPTELVGGNSNE